MNSHLQKRFAHLTPAEIDLIQENVDREYDRILKLSEEVDLEMKLTTTFQQYLEGLKHQMDEAHQRLLESFRSRA